ncbi:hypothetical protein [Polynucleobacter sp. MWH-Jannik1A5]|uniref:hypothetical protein n=1 Tax=Polynucleobacter sp. MWH-Jannik1A5 TaxID=1855890 RepID=UPI001C0CE8E8|nr:hypothetical protein [Polynucleobacter sp. MWH-Jannik1A5]MBU3547280.1 hypothetical protein [Polynucleobacter sp. MWH-Jannik1A5]
MQPTTLPPPKKKGGRKRKADGQPLGESTLRTRAFQERKRFESVATEIAQEALVYQLKSIAPKDLPESALENAHSKAQRALEIVINNAEGITQALVDKALSGDIQASQLLINRFLPERKQLLKFSIQPTVDQTAHSIVTAAATGQMDADGASKAMALLEKAGSVSLSGAIVDRIYSLQKQIEEISSREAQNNIAQIDIVSTLP